MERNTKILFEYFLKKYGDKYSNYEISYLKENFERALKKYITGDNILQVRSEIGIINPQVDFYQENIDRIRKNFDVSCNILDVASGRLPAFANRIAKLQMKQQQGTITICDPRLVIDNPKYPNMTMTKEPLTEDTNIDQYSMITSIFPCEASELTLRRAIKENKDFYIILCDCSKEVYEKSTIRFVSANIYHRYLIKLAQTLMTNYRSDELVVEYLDEKYAPSGPILYNRKR